MSGHISIERILERLDSHLHKNDYSSAERHLLYWLEESQRDMDHRAELLIRNELMGLYRKLGREREAFECVEAAIQKIEELGIGHQVGAATTFLNCATVCKAFGEPQRSLTLFERARRVYECELDASDERLGGLYNNMALTLVDLRRFDEANAMYENAITIMKETDTGALEVAITYLNMASAAEAELGSVNADEKIQEYMDSAQELIENYGRRDGYYAFVCEKCASVFGYYGRFLYENELKERAGRIYRGEGN